MLIYRSNLDLVLDLDRSIPIKIKFLLSLRCAAFNPRIKTRHLNPPTLITVQRTGSQLVILYKDKITPPLHLDEIRIIKESTLPGFIS